MKATTEKMTPLLACDIAEDEDATQEQQVKAWQYLHDTRLAYSLQGWYGRTAASLIERGVINK